MILDVSHMCLLLLRLFMPFDLCRDLGSLTIVHDIFLDRI